MIEWFYISVTQDPDYPAKYSVGRGVEDQLHDEQFFLLSHVENSLLVGYWNNGTKVARLGCVWLPLLSRAGMMEGHQCTRPRLSSKVQSLGIR